MEYILKLKCGVEIALNKKQFKAITKQIKLKYKFLNLRKVIGEKSILQIDEIISIMPRDLHLKTF